MNCIIRLEIRDKVCQTVLIPRMFVTPPETRFSFRMRRRQFPLDVAFTTIINKNQGYSSF